LENFTLPIPVQLKAIKTSVKNNISSNIIEFAEKHKVTGITSNLYDVERTDWKLHEKPGADIILQPVFDKIASCSSEIVSPAYYNYHTPQHNIELNFYDTWVAWFNSKSATAPHTHNSFITHFGFVLYLKLPTGKSSLGFNQCTTSRLVEVYENDLIIFPSFIPHWSFDMSDGRTLLSGNFKLVRLEEL
jgi:hypothetical protein